MVVMYIALIVFMIFIALILMPIVINAFKYPEINFAIKNRQISLILICLIGIRLSMGALNLIPISMEKMSNKLFPVSKN
jgi:hypothetical protein